MGAGDVKKCTMLEMMKTTEGRRIGKFDAAALEVTYYYYNDQWQILAEYDGTAFGNRYVYGNYIDEVLLSVIPAQAGIQNHYYLHDHLYSPAALLDDTGAVVERYEYDAYGSVRILNSEFSILNSSQYGNPHAFTGRQLDILDSGTLHHMHYRHRDYSPQLGRFLQQDPLGINPFEHSGNNFWIEGLHYLDGINLYVYTRNTPLNWTDSWGLFVIPEPPGSDGSGGGGGGWGPPGTVPAPPPGPSLPSVPFGECWASCMDVMTLGMASEWAAICSGSLGTGSLAAAAAGKTTLSGLLGIVPAYMGGAAVGCGISCGLGLW